MFPNKVSSLNNTYSLLAHKFEYTKSRKDGDIGWVENDSRNGKVREFVHPVTFTVERNNKYFLTVPGRVINLPFVLAELLWIMSGDHKIWIGAYNKQVLNYADEIGDQFIFNAAYGYRMRKQFSIDQLEDVIHGFAQDMNSRQNVIVYRHPVKDRSKRETNDRACNIASVFSVRNGKLNLSQIVRSNDFIWGLPYNLIQFGHIQQTIAEYLDLEIGDLNWFAHNLHVYEPHFEDLHAIHSHESLYPYGLEVPKIGDAVKTYLSAQENYLVDGWENTIRECALRVSFTEKDIRNFVGNSPFWYNGCLVLLSYWRRHDAEWCLETLDKVESDLFRLLALRYYYKYFKSIREKIELRHHHYAEKQFIRS